MSSSFVNLFFKATGAKKVKTDVAAIGVASKTANLAVSGLKTNLGLLAAGFGLFKSIQIVAEFGQEMATVKAITGATGEDFDMLRLKAKNLGAETRFSAGQAAEAMKFLGQAGFDTNAIMGSVEGTLRLAQAGALDLGRAADIASNVLTGFGLSTDETGRVVDVLAKAASSANTDVSQLGEALKFAAPVAAGLGVSLEETTAAIGALSDAGLQGTLAGTGLRLIMAKMTSVTPNATKALAEMGLTVEEINPRLVGFTGAIEAMASKGGTIEDMFKIFQIRGAPAAEILKNNTLKLNDLSEALVNSKGTAADMAKVMDATLKGAALRLFSAMSDLVISLADLGGESLLTKGLDAMATAILKVSRNLDEVGKIIITVLPLMAALFGGGMVNSIKLMSMAVGGLGKKMLMAFAPLLSLAIVPALIAAMIAGIVLFKDKIVLFQGSTATVADAFTVIGDRLQGLKGWMLEWFEAGKDVFEGMISGNETLMLVWKELQLFIKNFEWADIARGAAQVIDVVVGGFKGLWDAIMIGARGFFGVYVDLWKAEINLIIAIVNKLGEGAAAALNLVPGVQVEFDGIKKLIRDPNDGALALGKEMGNALVDGVMNQTAMQDSLENFYTDVKDVANDRELDVAKKAIEKTIVEPLKTALIITDEMREAFGKIGSAVSEIDFTGLGAFLSKKAADTGTVEIEKMIEGQQRQLAMRQALNIEERVGLELQFMRIDMARDNMTVTDEQLARLKAVILATENANLSFSRGASEALEDYRAKLEDVGSSSFDIISGAFQGMEDALVSFVQTGKLDFKSMIDSMISDLIRLMIQQSIMKAVTGIPFANGGVPDTKFANGGIVNSPTLFPFANGSKVGLMGEAGSEAIMPLQRMSDGKLGIHASGGGGGAVYAPSVTINVNAGNASQEEASNVGEETARQLDRVLETRMIEFTRKMKRPGNILNQGINY